MQEMTDEDKLKTHSFRANEDTVEYLDWLIDQKNAQLPPGSDERISRSDVLRECINDVIEELEDEVDVGNSTSQKMMTAD